MAFIVYGTGFFNRRNFTSVRTGCPQCGGAGHLRSYDAGRYFALYWIPIIPIGRRRVMYDCPHCRQAVAVPLARWQRDRDAQLPEALKRHETHPRDAEAAEAALDAAMTFQDEAAFCDAALRIEQHLADDPKLMAKLAESYSQWCMDELAEAAFLTSLAGEESAETRVGLAVHLLHTQRPGDAMEHVEAVVADDQASEKHAPLVAALLESYQSLGQHDEANAALDRLLEVRPDVADHDEVAKLSGRSRKFAGKRRRFRGTSVAGGQPRPRAPNRLGQALPLMVVPAILLGLAAVYITTAMRSDAEVYAVNGLAEPYDVVVDGTPYTLAPGRPHRITLPYGTSRIEPADDTADFEPAEVTLEGAPLLLRPLRSRVHVLNPDRMAVMMWEEAEYVPHDHLIESAAYDYTVFVGDPLYHFENVDFLFRELPDEIELPGSGSITRSSVRLVDGEPYDRFLMLLGEQEEERIAAFLRRALAINPDDLDLLRSVPLFDPDARTFLDTRRGDRPVRTDWHRYYQVVVDRSDPDHDLAGEYRRLHEAEPDDRELMYLVGRLTDDPAERADWFRRSITRPSPSAHGYHALAYDAMGRADFAAALAYARQADRLLPGHPDFAAVLDDAALAAGDHEALYGRLHGRWQADPADLSRTLELVRLLTMMDGDERIDAIVKQHVRAAMADFDDLAYPLQFRRLVRVAQADARGDVEAFLDASGTEFGYEPYLLMLRGELREADELLAEDDAGDADDHLLLYALGVAAGEDELAARHLSHAIELLEAGDDAEAALAEWLAADAAPSLGDVIHLPESWIELRTILTVLGARFEDQREVFFEQARLRNYSRTYPRLLLLRILDDRPQPQASHNSP